MIYSVTLNPAIDRELVIEDFVFDTVLQANQSRVDCGGKGFNVSRMLYTLGCPSIALAFTGGQNGKALEDKLHLLGIKTDFIRVEGETRTNTSIVLANHTHYLKVNEAGPYISPEAQQQMEQKVRQSVCEGDWWVLAGSLPPGVGDDCYARLVKIIQSRGAYAVVDASGAALEMACRAGAYLVKPNHLEAQAITGIPVRTPQDAVAAGRALLALGAQKVVLSMGKDGAVSVEPRVCWHALSPRIDEHNPIGAGDSLAGGLVWGMSRQMEMSLALSWGVACGAGSASLSGTEIADRELVECLLRQVIMQKLETRNMI